MTSLVTVLGYGEIDLDAPLPDIIPSVYRKHWPPEREAVLILLVVKGLSASEIAKVLGGSTKNAVIGKVRRLNKDGIKIALKSQPPARHSVPRGPRLPKKQRQRRIPAQKALPSQKPVVSSEANRAGVPVPLFDIDLGSEDHGPRFHCEQISETASGNARAMLLDNRNSFFERAGRATCHWIRTTSTDQILRCMKEITQRKRSYCDDHHILVYRPTNVTKPLSIEYYASIDTRETAQKLLRYDL